VDPATGGGISAADRLADVMARHRAQYLNVTEAFWDEEPEAEAIRFIPRRCSNSVAVR